MLSLSLLLPRGQDCTNISADCPVSQSFYGYSPSLGPDITLLVLFSMALVGHGVQGWYYRAWGTLTAMLWGCICEVLGYIGRLMMHPNAFNLNGFLIQICCLTIAPAFFSAAIYLCLSRLVLLFGTEVSRLPPKYYAYIFISCDIVSLALQGAGGGLASVAAQNDTSLTVGDNFQLAGLAFQVASLTLFAVLSAEYAFRVYRSPQASARAPGIFRHNKGLMYFLVALATSWLFIEIRCIYRVIELAGGWGSSLMKKQTDFVVLEGAMIIIAVGVLNAFYPGKYLNRAVDPEKLDEKKASDTELATPTMSATVF
ncbi:hypothetical protein HO133_003180 [Letharia lupina]|uniref:Sphingoid long-chain base transporter RSB1 n=1 Tax=Letharia lupina TaxID=560253 RepID=A0A8H6F9Z0_9LECA|nr:uncharacterized protein HO133_003180 [Letharia lupina]KAF6220747.1 hypothetical protein HO133_003180 [Letharia lupina]